ncbi:hypothetical protein TRVL_10252 [Trypanosoma vivax]|nr:hypothetical protein TRVL_10252 [Trypanosoma vivax]
MLLVLAFRLYFFELPFCSPAKNWVDIKASDVTMGVGRVFFAAAALLCVALQAACGLHRRCTSGHFMGHGSPCAASFESQLVQRPPFVSTLNTGMASAETPTPEEQSEEVEALSSSETSPGESNTGNASSTGNAAHGPQQGAAPAQGTEDNDEYKDPHERDLSDRSNGEYVAAGGDGGQPPEPTPQSGGSPRHYDSVNVTATDGGERTQNTRPDGPPAAHDGSTSPPSNSSGTAAPTEEASPSKNTTGKGGKSAPVRSDGLRATLDCSCQHAKFLLLIALAVAFY